ncbi:MAG: MBL fold metallo-hydrolase, partial [Eubacteriales bacterium]|nr:MBL fold metallo-hydrolase [Eubacteriales bacterium]
IGRPDVLMTPVGGTYTTNAETAAENVRLLRPRVTIPMHYRTRFSEQMPIDTEEPFLRRMKAHPAPMPLCRLTKGDMEERPDVLLMAVTDNNDA